MESEYDRKFEDMKKYIPFLESMIKRLESTSTLSANPRQAQLDKIRSLRDLLLDKKKRMKMENLLKCEQVLINLYAKVEQRDTLPNAKKSNASDSGSPRMDSSTQLEIVRNKLKRVSKIQDGADTLPEIVRASDVEDVCMTGSVEPALFQRRPHRKSPTLSDISSSSQDKVKSPDQNTKRKYTRVLYSPEPDARIRSSNPDSSLDLALFSRRSPKKSSSSHNKKEGKKISSHKTSKKTKDLNITLKVPQESLNSLNTKDILSRIITCNDNDVDIDTLRGLRSQILGELKQTGTKDDISDLILKSYAGTKTINRTKEVEEGELSDSESEAIESIYGSLVLVDKVKSKNEVTSVPEKDQPRKIQICLVINSREGEASSKGALKPNQSIRDDFDLEMFDETETNKSLSTTEDIKAEKPKPSSCGERTSDLVSSNDDDDNTKNHESLKPTKLTESKNNKNRAIGTAYGCLPKVVEIKKVDITNKDVKITKKSSNSGNKNETYEITKDAIDRDQNAMVFEEKTDCVTNKDIPHKRESDIVVDKIEPNGTNEYVNNKEESDNFFYKNESSVTDTDQTNDIATDSDKVYDKNEASVTTVDENSKKAMEKVVDKNEVSVTNKFDRSPKLLKQNNKNSDSSVQFKANFYKPILVEEKSAPLGSIGSNKQNNRCSQNEKSTISSIAISSILDKNECVKIPLLDEPIMPHQPAEKDIDAQIDILQALKNEILGDNILPVPEVVTPLLHQPKVTKVSQVQGIMHKKRISIEKYKEKTTPLMLNPCINDDSVGSPLRDDNGKKQSLKLTEKECERFNFPAKIDIDDDVSSEDECQKESKMSVDEIYKDFAPKSPDNDDINLMEITQPVIIPIDPVKAPVVNFKADVDMRTLPLLSPKDISLTGNNTPLSSICQKNKEHKLNEILDKSSNKADRNQSPLMDPRMRRDSNQSTSVDSSNSGAVNLGKISNIAVAPNVICAPNITPSMTPTSRSFDMTPNRLNDFEDVNVLHKHVYAPSFSLLDSRDSREHSILSDVSSPQESEVSFGRRKSRWEENIDHDSRSSIPQNEFNTQRSKYGDTHKSDKNSENTDDSIRGHGSMTPLAQFGWSEGPHMPNRFGRPEGPVPLMMLNLGRPECPLTPSHPFGRSDCSPAPSRSVNKSDLPGTPSHPFGRVDCPMTPSHPFGRSDCPTTPIHSFGRADCPATPSHAFGRIDCPPSSSNPFTRIDYPVTPSHSFGMSDCPTTPSHPFGRSDCPTTPSHPFGRIDGGVTPTYSFGRTEQSHNISMGQQYSKDPRLNRRFDSRSQRDERDNRNFKDRGFNTRSSYEMHHRAFSRSDSFTNHDRDDEERSRSMSRSERNFGHVRPRDNYFDQSDNRDLYKCDNRSRPRERCTEDRYRLERSAGRNPDSRDTHVRSQSKSRSITRNDNRETENDNTVSVKSHAGRSFTIDTSVNSTFQDLLKKKGLQILSEPFDSRKQRAASVGRSEVSNFDKDRISKSTSCHLSTDDSEYRTRDYRRASSVGRDLRDTYDSFQKAKTDFKNYQEIIARKDEKQRLSRNATSEHNKKSSHYSDSQNYKPDNTLKTGKQAYSARNNYRDPRMRREYDDKNSHRGIGNYYDKNKHGINYSSNNLAKGAVLGSGYGVKNYKIPKIKRPTTEVQEEEKPIEEKKAVEIKNKKNDLKEIKNSDKERCSNVEKIVTEGTPEKRLTRSSKNKNKDLPAHSDNSDIRKRKRPVIHDSSSDAETYDEDPVCSNILSRDDEKISIVKYSQNNQDQEGARETTSSKDTSETEIFFDNVISDPVIDNINALIADLDNHIDNSKAASSEDFNDITFDDDLSNMSNLETISLSKENTFDALFNKEINEQRESKDGDENLIQENSTCTDILPKTLHSKLDNTKCKSTDISVEKQESEVCKNQVHNLPHPLPNPDQSTLLSSEGNKSASNIDATVSTTNNDKLITNTLLEGIEKSVESISVKFETSAADSTNEITSDNTKEHNLPDSTNDVNDINSLVSSSHSVANVPTEDVEPNVPQQDTVPPLDSIGSILSILKDKSKIHQLLCMIGEKSGDNDKIKRKLEKLSEIVSDDEEEVSVKTTDEVGDRNEAIKDCTFEEKHSSTDEKPNDMTLENAEQSLNVFVNPDSNAGELEPHEQPLITNDIESKDEQNKTTRNKGKVSKNTKKRNVKAKKTPRVTRVATGQIDKKPPTKKPSRELQKLREDIKEMFLTDEMLNSTGIRMCRLAKLVGEKSLNRKEDTSQDPKPFVMIEKFKPQEKTEDAILIEKLIKKKLSPKTKRKASTNEDLANERSKLGNTKGKAITKNISLPKSKIKPSSKQEEIDPYDFETDSVDTSTIKSSESEEASDCETNSLASSKSFGSTEVLADLQKKTKRKRRGKAWQTGIIKPKYKKKKSIKPVEKTLDKVSLKLPRDITIPDNECFIDKYYCFERNVGIYPCRLCEYAGDDIILHYKKQHPHIEIPLSRMNSVIAKEAIEQCQEVNFPAISKISTDRYVCRFCYKEFSKSKTVLETFFWHVVSMHTGEYKQACSECANNTCYFNLDIPPPPKDNTGQLIGYLCGKCNYTQVSLENLKTHVIGRHNDEQTDVYTINLAVMTKKTLKTLAKHQATIAARVLRSSRSNQSTGEDADDHEELVDNTLITDTIPQSIENVVTVKSEKKDPVTSMQSKIVFESEENITPPDLASSHRDGSIDIKQENIENENIDEPSNSSLTDQLESGIGDNSEMEMPTAIEVSEPGLPDDVMAHAHFKICYKESGAKEYVCCVNGTENHYKTTLLISMKKHVQSKHNEHWDGFCVLCKVIVTAQGLHHYSECLQHLLDKHMDEFPVLELNTEVSKDATPRKNTSEVTAEVPKPYINVRPLNQLISSTFNTEITNETTTQFPKIQSVVSLGAHTNLPQSSPSYPILCTETPEEKQYRYEDWQAEVMSKKHRVVLNSMMAEEKLVKVFKCTGKFCSFTTDNVEKALLHATTHQRIGGEGALNCSYCDFDAFNNGIDLVMHVFKEHGKCPYTCKLCFYRATSSQLVSSHISRLHSERQSFDAILHTTTVATPVADDDNLMSREEAVPSYVCGHSSSEGDDTCKFRTFTPGQFGEHLIRHQPPYPCNMCGSMLSSASELVHHMKSHGLRLYQCTSCVFGADNEPEMLAHAAARHPDRLPQAYLRVITNKDGSAEFRVLPRAILNKLKATSRAVSSSDTDNPVREAERSLALEKLIGHTESVTSIEPVQPTNECDDDTNHDTGIIEDSEILLTENVEQELSPPPAGLTTSDKSNPASATVEIKPKSLDENVSLVVKNEPGLKAPNISSETVIYCLDSDDEESTPRVIDISDDDLISVPTASTSKAQEPSEYKKKPLDKLFLCPSCLNVNRNLCGFKRHVGSCLASSPYGTDNIDCPHENCHRQLHGVVDIANHYLQDHADRKITVYACGICKAKYKTVALTKKHMKDVHKSNNFMVTFLTAQGDTEMYTVTEKTPSVVNKRKSSDAAKQKRYGPQDIDQLPINPILESLVHCSLCEFGTKVRLNMVRHLQLHAQSQPAPQTAPVNPVPHLETNERYFDRMVNLASSSITTRAPDKPARTDVPVPSLVDTGRYPKYVADRVRYTCGTKNCSYISVDEGMLRIHWETLHSNTTDYKCVHCPPHQYLDQTKPLTAARIIGHLKMHEENLYACSACSYYHFKRVAVEKHLQKCPKTEKDAQIMVVRESGVTPTPAPAPTSSAPTMDLKPWQCGLCSYKSLLRPKVTEHCFKIHQSKMQFKCNYCPFRTSVVENVTKHQTNAHPDKTEDVFYYYYREGSIADDGNGTPRWMRQKQNSGITEPIVKSEVPEPSTSSAMAPVVISAVTPVAPAPVDVNLSLVKQEVEDTETPESNTGVEGSNKRFGKFCEPSGTKYKCPLCTTVVEDQAEAMQSHLYEELKYRKWGCTICSYKAFHKTGLTEHLKSEHHRQFQEPKELPTDVEVEKWVAEMLEYQTNIIEKIKSSTQTDATPSTSRESQDTEVDLNELEQAFGSFGTPRDCLFCCPKCSCTLKDESVMKEHLESELTKIRWCCSHCSHMSHTYHEAQFHCKTAHPGESARPREALRSAEKRAAWVYAVLHTQRHSMNTTVPSQPVAEKNTDLSDLSDNSLLVVRYEERVQTPEDVTRRKRIAPVDSDEEKLVIDESEPAKKKALNQKACPYCDFKTKWANALREHILRHYNLKPYKCCICNVLAHRSQLVKHFEKFHPAQALRIDPTPMPMGPPNTLVLSKRKANVIEEVNQICLQCGKSVLPSDLDTHKHGDVTQEFAKKGEVVVKCCICLVLRLDVSSLQEHHNACHPDVPVNYAFFKLLYDSLECFYCSYCNYRFSYIRDLRSHHRAAHSGMMMKYTTGPPRFPEPEEDANAKRKNEEALTAPSPKRVAKKSTTKLPHNTVAKKSTTKLPYSVCDDEEEFSFYGTKPLAPNNYANVTTLMPFCNTLVPFTFKKLREIIKIEPIVLVEDDAK